MAGAAFTATLFHGPMNGFFFTRYGRLLVYGNILKLIMDCLQKYDMLVDYVQGEIEPT
mgnify:FL=1